MISITVNATRRGRSDAAFCSLEVLPSPFRTAPIPGGLRPRFPWLGNTGAPCAPRVWLPKRWPSSAATWPPGGGVRPWMWPARGAALAVPPGRWGGLEPLRRAPGRPSVPWTALPGDVLASEARSRSDRYPDVRISFVSLSPLFCVILVVNTFSFRFLLCF